MADWEKPIDHVENRGSNKSEDKQQNSGISFVDGLRIIVGLLLLSVLTSYLFTGTYTWKQNPWWLRPNALVAAFRPKVILTDAELLRYDGQDESRPIYLALNGIIYDVTSGRRIYGPGGPYHFFAGRDATRAYITGCFQDDSNPDVRGAEWTFIPQDVPRFDEQSDADLDPARRGYRREEVEKGREQLEQAVEHWAKMFRGEGGKDYFEVGYVRGRKGEIERTPVKTLCAGAEKRRPKGRFDETKQYTRSGTSAKGSNKGKEQRAEPSKKSGGRDEI